MNTEAKAKTRYKMANPQIIPCLTLWPHIPESKDRYVAEGFVVVNGVELENATRTGLILKMDLKAGYIETLNSIYEIV